MTEWLTSNDREEAIYVLQQRLTAKQMRSIINRDVERIVVTTERIKGLYSSRLGDEDLPGFLVDLHGLDLLQDRELRAALAQTLPADVLGALVAFDGDEVPRSKQARVEAIATRRWVPGKQWPREFASAVGIPKIFAGLVGSPANPATEEVEPHIPLLPLHDYQQELVSRVHQILDNEPGRNRAILSLPTGAGKTRTVVEALLMWWGASEETPPYLLWIAQSDELCEQAIEAFREVWVDRGGRGPRKVLRLYRCWGQYKALPEAYGTGVVVASIQKLYEMASNDDSSVELNYFAKETAAIVVDEAHHATATSYTRVLNTFGVKFDSRAQSTIPLIGLTATPYRGSDIEDNHRLARRFHGQLLVPEVLGEDPIGKLRVSGILSKVDHKVLDTGITFELTEAEQQRFKQLGQLPDTFLRKVGYDPDRNALLLKTILELPSDWPVLLFGCSVEHANALAVLLRRSSCSAATVTGLTRRATRRHLIDEFRHGRIRVLCNFGVLTTGFDAPRIRAVVIARPTTSVVLYEQMIGRGMRGPLNGGTDTCTVIDLHDNINRFKGQMAYNRMRELWR